jgi:hypothetical protein
MLDVKLYSVYIICERFHTGIDQGERRFTGTTQVAFYDDAERNTQMLNALCDELDKRVSTG